MKTTLVIALAAAVVGGLAGAAAGLALDGQSSDARAASAAVATSPTTAASATNALTPETIYRRDARGVVVITDNQTEQTPFSEEKVTALGSGFVVDKKGDIVTNDHVVQGSSGIRVGFSSGSTYPATVVGADPSTDVAVVRVKAPASALRPLAYHDSAHIAVGDPVYAIGNPFGLDRTMTAGIVSAIGRGIQAPNGLTIANAIQTDAPINHGNSGGPLLDRFGRVIGINSQIQSGTVNANVGVGFAIPSDTAESVARQLMQSGHAEHAWVGVEVLPLDPSLAGTHGLPRSGVVVARVFKGSPAAKAGLRPATRETTVNGVGTPLGGDVVVRAEGTGVTSPAQLGAIVAAHRPGDRLQLVVVRNGSRRTVTVTLGDVPAQRT